MVVHCEVARPPPNSTAGSSFKIPRKSVSVRLFISTRVAVSVFLRRDWVVTCNVPRSVLSSAQAGVLISSTPSASTSGWGRKVGFIVVPKLFLKGCFGRLLLQ